jgi:hypothetical protein
MSNRLAFAALSVACVGAAAAGGYYASRPAEPADVQTASSAPAGTPPMVSPSAAAAGSVRESEAVVSAPRKEPLAPSSSAVAASRRADKAPAKGAAVRHEPLSTPANTWPRNAQFSPATPNLGSAPGEAPAPHPVESVERAAPEPPRAPEPPQKVFEELAISADSVIGLQTETRITSETARVEDRVEARVTRDVKVGDRVAIAAGSRAIGSVIQVERGGKFKERARLGIRFHTLVLADGTRLPISTETVFRDGEAPTAAAKVGGAAIGGAILGAILGGGKGAAIGGAAGAGAGATAAANTDRNAAVFPPGSQLTVRLVSPVTVTIER